MLRKFAFGLMAVVFSSIVFSVSSFAQLGPVRGIVKLEVDGKQVPVADAIVEPIRVDIETGKAAPAKTNKNGEFSFAGLSLVSQYVLAISGPGIAPTVSNTIKGGNENVVLIVSPGDGKRLTEAEVREMLKAVAKGPQTPQSEAEQRKAQAEYEKQKAKYEEEKKKVDNVNKVVGEALKAGETAFKAKDYAGAIAKFDEGIAADPDFEGSAPVLQNYKGVALKARAFEAYERATKADAAGKAAELEKAKVDFGASAASFERALQILANAKVEDPAVQASLAKVKYSVLSNYIETYRLMVKTKADVSRAKDAIPVYEQYFVVEVDATKKLNGKLTLADILREAGESEPAIVAYRSVLELSPDNPDALAGLGLSLFNVGVVEDNKAKMQEGLNMMQKFADSAPDTHPLKQSVKEAVDYLKTEQKMAPQKAPAKKRT